MNDGDTRYDMPVCEPDMYMGDLVIEFPNPDHPENYVAEMFNDVKLSEA